MKRLALSIALAALCAAPAMADGHMTYKGSAPDQSSVNWNGFYVGGHLGGAWEDVTSTALSTTPVITNGTANPFEPSGALGGAQLGFNIQRAMWVFGIEGDISWTGVDETGTVPSTIVPGVTASMRSDTDWYATVTGRVGWAKDNWLAYLKAGGAWMDVSYTGSAALGAVSLGSATVTDTRSGWTIGTGIEVGIQENWSAKFEYSYADFGTDNYSFNVGGVAGPTTIETDMHVVKVGLNYRFGGRRGGIAMK